LPRDPAFNFQRPLINSWVANQVYFIPQPPPVPPQFVEDSDEEECADEEEEEEHPEYEEVKEEEGGRYGGAEPYGEEEEEVKEKPYGEPYGEAFRRGSPPRGSKRPCLSPPRGSKRPYLPPPPAPPPWQRGSGGRAGVSGGMWVKGPRTFGRWQPVSSSTTRLEEVAEREIDRAVGRAVRRFV